MQLKLIRTRAEYERSMEHLSKLMVKDVRPGSPEADELELLGLIIEDYERSIVPEVRTDPIDAILFRMDQMNLVRKELEPYLGSASKVSEVLSRKRPLSITMIRKLHTGLGIPAEILLRGSTEPDTRPKRPGARPPTTR